jgi:hypothetical protein
VNKISVEALVFALLTAGCANTSGVERRTLGDGSQRLSCRTPLTRCLAVMDEVCPRGYEILRARQQVDVAGPMDISPPSITTEVDARCLGGVPPPTASAALPAPTPAQATPRCVPGATQACVGAGACRGGQQCLADGAAFGPCDCGTSDPSPSPSLPSP